ncbi:MAG: hypothetical protein ACP5UP_08280 [Athalassotoga sp.]|uniref:hypothetical protein n=1 Tax=Athalassotoga sp. TaxID=2022597 RepID=UPI003CFDBDA0
MKRVVVILMVISLMVLLGGSIFAQGTSGINARLVNQAGQQLESYTFQYYMGFWLQVGGIVGAGILASVSPALSALGLIAVLAGEVIQFLAAGNIGAAGASLISASIGQ